MLNSVDQEVEQILARIFAAESRAAARNRAFAAKADKEQRPGPAALFLAAAKSGEVRSRRLLNLMRGKIGDTDQNLAEAFGESRPGLYPDPLPEAAARGGRVVQNALTQGRGIEKTVSALYRSYQARPESRPDYLVCRICGHLVVGQAPERCPVCKAIREKFQPAR